MSKVYVVEYEVGNGEWDYGEWVGKEFNSLEKAEVEALELLGMGYAVRMYIKE